MYHYKIDSMIIFFVEKYVCFAVADNCTDKFAKAHACKLLELNNQGSITLWNRHPSGVKDNATALDNIRDACNGTAASRSQ